MDSWYKAELAGHNNIMYVSQCCCPETMLLDGLGVVVGLILSSHHGRTIPFLAECISGVYVDSLAGGRKQYQHGQRRTLSYSYSLATGSIMRLAISYWSMTLSRGDGSLGAGDGRACQLTQYRLRSVNRNPY